MKKRECLEHLEEVTAIVPAYDTEGAVTRVFTRKYPEQKVHLTLKAVLKRLAACYGKDLSLLRQLCAKHTHMEQGSILAFSPGVVLMPWKVCRPRVPKDPAMGLLNVAWEVKLSGGDKDTLALNLPGGEKLPVLWSKRTFTRHHALAKSMFLWVNAKEYQELLRARGQYTDLLNGLG